MKCDNDDGTISWYRRVYIVYLLLNGQKRAVKSACKDNPDMLRQLPNVVRHFKAVRKRHLAEKRK